MTDSHLLYQWDRERGRMELHVHGVRLNKQNRIRLAKEIRQRYEALIQELDRAKDAVVIQFSSLRDPAEIPTEFRVRFAETTHLRNPGMIFVPHPTDQPIGSDDRPENLELAANQVIHEAEPLVAEVQETERSLVLKQPARGMNLRPWIAGLLWDLEDCFANANPNGLGKIDRAAMQFVVGEFRTLCRESPDELAILILAGYVALCEDSSHGVNSEETALYTLAARGLDQLFAAQDATDSASDAANQTRRKNSNTRALRNISRMLARLLGLDDF